jgi:predicted component of type VI protein secretion system
MTDVKLEVLLYVESLQTTPFTFLVDEEHIDHYVKLVGVSEIGKRPKVSVHLLLPPEDVKGLSLDSDLKLTLEWVKA